jgi:hypothetical protein
VSTTWESAFVAVSVLVGEPADAIEATLGGPDREDAAALLHKLLAASREARARGLARVVSEVAVVVDAARLA